MHSLKAWCRNSLTIFWARLQMAVGALIGAAAITVEITQASNAHQLLPPAYVPYALVAMGVITEVARRRKEWQK